MKSKFRSASRFSSLSTVIFAGVLATTSAQALTYYWDNNGTTAGFGTAAGTWASPTTGSITQGWSQDSTGGTTPVNVTTATADTMNFGTNTDGLATGTVAVTGTVNAGNITIGSTSGAITIGTNGTSLILTAAGSGSSTITNNSASAMTIGSSLTTGALIKAGTGQLSLSNATNAYAGNTTISAGNIRVGGAGRLNSGSYAGLISIASGSIFNYGSSDNHTFSGVISGLGSISKDTSTTSTLILSNNSNSFSGGVTLSAGSLQIGTTSNATVTSTVLGSGTLTINAGTIRLGVTNSTITTANDSAWNGSFNISRGTTGPGTWNHQGAVTLGANVTVSNFDTNVFLNVSGNISETGGARTLTLTGLTNTLSGTNTYTGGTNVTSGSVQFAKLLSMSATGTVAMSTGTTLAVNAGGTGEFTNATSGAGSIGGLLALSAIGGQGAAVTFAGNANLGIDTTNAGGSLTYAGVIANRATTMGITKLGTGTLVISGTSNTYTGGTIINAGTLNLTGNMAASTLIVNTGGTFLISSTGVKASASILIFGGTLQVGTATTSNFQGAITTNTSGGVISSDGTTARTLTNSLVLSGSLTLGDTINNGKLTFNTSTTSGFGAAVRSVTVLSDAVFNIPLSGAGGGINKLGAATLTLSGLNTYTGNTSVSAGKLFINGNQTSATGDVSVSANATLGGTGIIGGTTTIADTGKLEFNLSTAFGSHDKLELAVGKTLTFTLASTLTITSSGGASPGLYTLVTAPGAASITGAVPATVNLPSGWTATAPVIVADGPNTSLQINITSTGGGGDVTPPTLASSDLVDNVSGAPVTVGTLVTYTVTFSEDIDAATVTAADFGNAGTAAVTIGTVTETTPGVFTVQATPTSTGTLQLRVNASAVITDTSANALNTGSAIADNTTITVQTAYQTWSGGAAFDADANNDGVKNGLAFLLGAAGPNAAVTLPVTTQSSGNLVLNFTMLNAANRGSTALYVEHSSDLGISDPWLGALVPDTSGSSGPINGVTFNVILASPSNSVTATIQSSQAASGKLFGRLKAVQTP